jgi:hypothetical protein
MNLQCLPIKNITGTRGTFTTLYRTCCIRILLFGCLLANTYGAHKIIKLKCIVKFVVNAWATFKPWSKYGVDAWSMPMQSIIKCECNVSIIKCKSIVKCECIICNSQMRMNGQYRQILTACWLLEITPIIDDVDYVTVIGNEGHVTLYVAMSINGQPNFRCMRSDKVGGVALCRVELPKCTLLTLVVV